MKKSKLLTPIITAAGLASVVIPLTTLTGCAKTATGNLMEEYTPTIGQMTRTSFATPDDALVAYLKAIETTPEIFVQDFRYTVSRGMPEYMSYVSKFCEIAEHNFNVDIDKNTVKVDYSEGRRTITFEATFDIIYDYTGTKYDEMVWYDIPTYRWDTKTKVKFVFDMDTRKFADYDILGLRRQMTTIAGATQFGISELNSTVQCLSETGYYIDLNNIRHDIDNQEAGTPGRFILPDQSYWASDYVEKNEYKERYNEVSKVWYNMPGIQVIILILKYYMGTSQYNCVCPSVLDFGSYFMAKSTLDNPYTFKINGNDCELCGFNLSLDSINNLENLNGKLTESGDYIANTQTLTLPSYYNEKVVSEIADNAFDSSQSVYTNVGLPNAVREIIIPQTVDYIGFHAFSSNPWLKSIKICHGNSSTYPEMQGSAFVNLANVDTIDFSEWKNDDLDELITQPWDNSIFKDIHMEQTSDKYGTVYVPPCNDEELNKWKAFLPRLGLDVYNPAEQKAGWEVTPLLA